MPPITWRLRLYDGIRNCAHVGRQSRAAHLRRNERNHEGSHWLGAMNVENHPLEKQLSYWETELARAPTGLELPTDTPRAALQTFRAAKEIFTLPRELLERLTAVGRNERTTLSMTLVAGFMVLLHRYTGEDDIVVGAPIFERRHSEPANSSRCVVKTVALRSRFTEHLDFRSLLEQVRQCFVGALAHPHVPFGQLATALGDEQAAIRAPLFQVMIILTGAEAVSPRSSTPEDAA